MPDDRREGPNRQEARRDESLQGQERGERESRQRREREEGGNEESDQIPGE